MFKSIIDDVKHNFTIGNMVTKLIIINIIIYIVAALLIAFSRATIPFDVFIDNQLALSAQPIKVLMKPWTLISHMFLHTGLGHVLWNMVALNLFGRITGDLMGDRRILPLYFFGGLVAAAIFIVSSQLNGFPNFTAQGASGAIMAIAMTAGLIAPDYNVRLLLLGDVKLKYILFVFLFFDIIGTQAFDAGGNSGGHFAHLGGALAGVLFIYFYRKGSDILLPFERMINYLSGIKNPQPKQQPKSKLRVEYRSENIGKPKTSISSNSPSFQDKLDLILDKINVQGYEKLTQEEKDFLKEASNKNL